MTLAALLGSCASNARDMRLSEADLSNMSVVQELGRGLRENERAALTTYAFLHRVSSTGFCGKKLTNHKGDDPKTIGEAIDLTIAREIAEARRQAEKPAWAHRWEVLTRERDRIVDKQGMLLAEHGPAADGMPAWAALQADLAENGRAMMKLRSSTGA